MKTRLASPGRPSAGYALLMVLFFATISIIVLAATMNRTATTANLNNRNNEYTASLNAAEAACEKVIARMRYDYLNAGLPLVTGNLGLYRGMVPTASEDAYWGNYQFTDSQGHVSQTYVQCISNTAYGPLQSQYPGLYAYYPVYRILSNARQTNGRYGITTAVQEDVTLNAVPIFQFAIFYNSLLEFSTCATMTVRGRVHANGKIYVGSGSPLTFYGTVTTTSTVSAPANAGGGPWTFPGNVTFNGSPGYSTNVPYILLPLGTNNVHSIIDMPPASEDPNSSLGRQRLYNEAQMVLLVSNTTVTAYIRNGQVPGADPSPTVISSTTNSTALSTNFPFLTITNTFKDKRENDVLKVTQINVGRYAQWASTNLLVVGNSGKFPSGSGTYPNILFVADNRTVGSGQLTAVRLTNGIAPPVNGGTGFSVATPNPLYVWGDYNQTNAAYLNTTNTTSGTVPCALMSDALTILSKNWADSKSAGSLGSENAPANTTVNAAILTGIVPSTGTTTANYSGGVHNLPRLLEDWSQNPGYTLTLNTSIVNLFTSQKANSVFVWPGTTYNPPTRQFCFDPNFADPSKAPPPGTPMLALFLRSSWAVAPPNTTNYYVVP